LSIDGNWDRRINRRAFLGIGGLTTAALALGPREALAQQGPGGSGGGSAGYGPLVEDPNGVLDLPEGFQYRMFSQEGTKLSSGGEVPGAHDGMAAYPGPGNTTVLVRNHEGGDVDGSNPYRSNGNGGTTAVVVSPNRKEVRDYVTSSGTVRNCSGGPTPWGTWLTCEETRFGEHGFVFEVNPDEPENALSKTPIRDMGQFSHEATNVDPQTGIVYLTEDGTSYLYRYLPTNKRQEPGALQDGGTLQAMAVEGDPTYDPSSADQGRRIQVVWRDVDPQTPPESAAAQGAVRFSRLEGADFRGGAFWFDDTSFNHIYRYIPSSNILELFYAGGRNTIDSPDNVVVTPFGDLWFCEDGGGTDRVQGITPEGEAYTFARNAMNDSELAGCTFSPDRNTFFVNIQSPGITLAIWGPFSRGGSGGSSAGRGGRNPGRQRQMAAAAPPEEVAPKISGELAEAAERHGMSPYEAAAFDHFGIPLA
jgi:secreted PhoX family phosphatase